jgi:hypothetical protein
MKQYKITSADLNPKDDNDCYLSPNDPIHDLMPASMMGGLGSMEALTRYNSTMKPTVTGSDKGQIQREQGIKPGTDEWFKLWFGKNNK